MTVQTDLAELLMAAGLSVDTSLRATAYGAGRCWVLLDSYDIDDPSGIILTVIVAVSPGHDLYGLLDKAWQAIEASDGFEPTSFAATYGAAPGGVGTGRERPPSDHALITVVTNFRF